MAVDQDIQDKLSKIRALEFSLTSILEKLAPVSDWMVNTEDFNDLLEVIKILKTEMDLLKKEVDLSMMKENLNMLMKEIISKSVSSKEENI